MAEKSRSLNFILLVCALIGAAWFFGCSGGTSSDPILVPVLSISGTVSSQDNLGNMVYDGNLLPDIRAQFAAPGILVHLASDESKNATTDKDGKYVITGLKPGTYQVVARIKVSDSLAYKAISSIVTVSDQKANAEVPQLELKKATVRVFGVVKKATGEIFPNARLTLWGETFYSESDGSFKSPLMFENLEEKIIIDTPGYQTVEMPVKFSENAPNIEQMVVTNSSENRPPVTSLSATRYAVDKLYEVNLTGSAVDVDKNIATYTWAKTDGEFTSDQLNPMVRTWFAPNSDTVATITFSAIDTAGLKSSAKVTIKVGKGIVVPNIPPTVDQIAVSPADISGARYYQLSIVATDTDKDLLTYAWSISSASGKAGTLQTTNTAAVTWITPDVTTQTDVLIKVVVSDRREKGAVERTLTLPVAPTRVNQAPVIAGIEISGTPVYGYTDYTLTVTASDPDNDPIYYQWVGSGTILEPNKATTPWKTPVVLAVENREVSVMVSDIKGASALYTATFAINPTSIRPPEVTILMPHPNDLLLSGKPVAFNGQAIASGNVEINAARFTWFEKLEGGQYGPLKTGTKTFSKTYNTPGTYTVKLEAYDSLNVTGVNTVTFRINATPSVTISGPAIDTVSQLGTNLSFSATGVDTEDVTIANENYYWTFPGDTGDVQGANQTINNLPAGYQTAKVYVEDSLTATSTTATRRVFINAPPIIEDIQPASGTKFMQGATVAFSTIATDSEGLLSAGNINWYMGATVIGTGKSFTKNDLPGGWNTITLKASDTMGGLATATIMVFINSAPTMRVDLPIDRSSIGLNQPFRLKGSGTDTAGTLDTMLFTWEDYSFNRDSTTGISVTAGGTPDDFEFTGYTNAADFGSHTITLKGTDRDGAIGSRSVEIFVNSPPKVVITSPASGTRHDTDVSMTFIATIQEDDPTDILSVAWYDAATSTTALATQAGLSVDPDTKEKTVSFTYSDLPAGPHNIFCQVTDMHGKTGYDKVGVLINRLPIIQSGKIQVAVTDITQSYATAPGNIPVFLSTNPAADLHLSIDDFDYELNGSIDAYDPERIKWFLNESESPVPVAFATGSVAVNQFPIGYNVVTVRIYDTYSPEFIDQASNSYQTSFYVWQSTEVNSPAGSVFLHGEEKTLYFGVNNAPRCIRAYEYFVGDLPVTKELDEPDNLYNLGNASVTFSLTACNGMLQNGRVTALGKVGATDYFVDFEDTATPATHTFAGMQGAVSVAFNTDDQTIGYMTNTSDELIRFSPLTWNLVSGVQPVTQVESKNFSSLGRVRFAPFNPAYGSRVCVADTGNNRVVRFNRTTLADPLGVNASSPIDMTFTPNHIITLSNTDKKVSVHRLTTSVSNHQMDFGAVGGGAGQFNDPIALYIYDGDLFILEPSRLQVIRSGEPDWLK